MSSITQNNHSLLSFYQDSNYFQNLCHDLEKTIVLPPVYIISGESKIARYANWLFSLICFPVGCYKTLQIIAGKVALLPASTPRVLGLDKEHSKKLRLIPIVNREWKYKRISLQMEHLRIDAMIYGTSDSLQSRKWCLYSNGNAQFLEQHLHGMHDFKNILKKIGFNALVFNYPGVGASEGFPTKSSMQKAYLLMLNFLEDKKHGLGAQEILCYGHSIGAGIQAESIKNHLLKNHIKYVFLKSRTFNTLSTIAAKITLKPLGMVVRLLGWEIDTVNGSRSLKKPEIILQSAFVDHIGELKESSMIKYDGLIDAPESLAKPLLDSTLGKSRSKFFFALPENHSDEIACIEHIAQKIQEFLLATGL